jgi:hypothetical protein
MFLDRGRRDEPSRFVWLKVGLFFAGAAVLLAGMVMERDVLVAVAIGILGVGFLLRFLERRDPVRWVADEDDPDDQAPPGDRPLPPDVPEDRRRS